MQHDPDILTELPEDFRLDEVEVRPATPQEWPRWDALCARYHYLGFNRLVAHGIRYVCTWRGKWLVLAAWQAGAFKCRPRDLAIGWKRDLQFKRLHLIANNTRFLVLANAGLVPNLASCTLSRMCARLADDWEERWGYRVLLAESFVDPSRFSGAMYLAAGWDKLGRTRGFARSNGRYTNAHGERKDLWIRTLRRDAKRILGKPGELAPCYRLHDPDLSAALPEVEPIRRELEKVKDFRRGQGRKHDVQSVLTFILLARLSKVRGVVPTAQYAASFNQHDLERAGAWKNPKTGLFEPPSKSTIHRVLQNIDTAELERVQARYSQGRLRIGAALAADGKRINGANRHGDWYHETVNLVAHDTGLPVASVVCNDEGGEIAAVACLLETAQVEGRLITLDALHTTRNTARRIVDIHGAGYMMVAKKNAPETFAQLSSIDWERDGTGTFEEEISKEHGRVENREIVSMTPLPGLINFPHVKQIFRVTRYRDKQKAGQTSDQKAGQGDDQKIEQSSDQKAGQNGGPEKESRKTIIYGMTSVPGDRAGAEQLLAWNRGHWSVEVNHNIRDTQFGEDASRIRRSKTPGNDAILNNIALAIIGLRKGCADKLRDFSFHRDLALQAVLGDC